MITVNGHDFDFEIIDDGLIYAINLQEAESTIATVMIDHHCECATMRINAIGESEYISYWEMAEKSDDDIARWMAAVS